MRTVRLCNSYTLYGDLILNKIQDEDLEDDWKRPFKDDRCYVRDNPTRPPGLLLEEP